MEEVLAEQRRPHPRYPSRETPAKGLGSTLENQKPWMVLNGTGKKNEFSWKCIYVSLLTSLSTLMCIDVQLYNSNHHFHWK